MAVHRQQRDPAARLQAQAAQQPGELLDPRQYLLPGETAFAGDQAETLAAQLRGPPQPLGQTNPHALYSSHRIP